MPPRDATARILILSSSEAALPASVMVERAIRDTLQERLGLGLDLYSEHLDGVRFPSPDHAARMTELLRFKHGGARLALVFAIGPKALEFAIAQADTIFGGAPVVFADVSQETLRELNLPPQFTGIVSQLDPSHTLDLALRLQPNVRQVAVITGAAPFEQRWESVLRTKLEAYRQRLGTIYLSGLTLDELDRRLAMLPRDTFVLYVTMFQDGSGRRHVPRDLVERISAVSSAPIYGLFETYLGRGIVGGAIDSYADNGATVARIGLQIIDGAKAQDIPVRPAPPAVYRVDWRQLERWGLASSRLPPETRILFKEETLWERYKIEILATAAVILLQAGLIIGLLTEARRRYRAQQSLLRSEERVSMAAISANLGFWQWELEGNRVWASDHARKLLGAEAADSMPLANFQTLLDTNNQAGLKQAIEHSIRTGDAFRTDCRLEPAPGIARWLSVQGRAALATAGRAARMHGVLIDITEHKKAEQEAQQQHLALTHLSRVGIAGEFAGALAHELNQPLAAILSNAQAGQRMLAEKTTDLIEIKAIFGDIIQDDKRVGEVIQRLRAMLKKGDTQRQPVDICALGKEALHMAHGNLIERGVSVTTRWAKGLPPVLADRVQVMQVLLNLIANACEAMNGVERLRRQLTISADPDGPGFARIEVADGGCGISAESEDGIFRPFYTTKDKGLGLGLSICRSIVENHGGRIWAHNSPGGGAVVAFSLPTCIATGS